MSLDNPRINWFGIDAPGGELIARYRPNMRWLEGGGIDPHAAIAQSRESGLPSEADAIPLLNRFVVRCDRQPERSEAPSLDANTVQLANQLGVAMASNPIIQRLAEAVAKALR
jgi:hypothetical protein